MQLRNQVLAGTAVSPQNSVQVSVGMSLPRSTTGVPVSSLHVFVFEEVLLPREEVLLPRLLPR